MRVEQLLEPSKILAAPPSPCKWKHTYIVDSCLSIGWGWDTFGPIPHLGPWLIWSPLIWAPDSFGPQHIWAPTHLGPDTFGPRLIWAPTHLGPNSFGPQHIWAPTHLGPDSFGPQHIWAPTHLGPGTYLSPKETFKLWKSNFKISKCRFSISHRSIFDKKKLRLWCGFTPIYRPSLERKKVPAFCL